MELHETRIGLQALDAVVSAAQSLEAIARTLERPRPGKGMLIVEIPADQAASILDTLEDAAFACDDNADGCDDGSEAEKSWRNDVKNLDTVSRALREAVRTQAGERNAENKETAK